MKSVNCFYNCGIGIIGFLEWQPCLFLYGSVTVCPAIDLANIYYYNTNTDNTPSRPNSNGSVHMKAAVFYNGKIHCRTLINLPHCAFPAIPCNDIIACSFDVNTDIYYLLLLFVCLFKRQRSIPNSVLYRRISRINSHFPAAI